MRVPDVQGRPSLRTYSCQSVLVSCIVMRRHGDTQTSCYLYATATNSSSSLQSNAPSRFGSHSPTASIQQRCLVIAILPRSPAGNRALALWSVAASPARPRAETAKRSISRPNGDKEAKSCGRTMFPIPASGRCTVNITVAFRAQENTSATRSVRRLAVSNACTTAVRSRAPSLARRVWSPAFGLVRTCHVPFSAVRCVVYVQLMPIAAPLTLSVSFRSARACRVTSLVRRSCVVVIRVHPVSLIITSSNTR